MSLISQEKQHRGIVSRYTAGRNIYDHKSFKQNQFPFHDLNGKHFTLFHMRQQYGIPHFFAI